MDKRAAAAEKELGNEAYKKKDFDQALIHYNKALEHDPNSLPLLNNIAAVYLEQGNLDECIAQCERAVELGREHRADFRDLAKALARAGKACLKKQPADLTGAKKYFDKSLSEHRDPDLVRQSQELQKRIKEQEAKDYEDPVKAEEERVAGNGLFTKGLFPEALKRYVEAIRRNPRDPRLYSNRAACYIKLAEFSLALKDCEETIKLDPNFVKAYLRKGQCLLMMKDTSRAADAYRKALELDPNCEEAQEGMMRAYAAERTEDPKATLERARKDPEVQAILSDPAMLTIIKQMESDPTSIREHLQNPDIANKIQTLIDKGILAIRSGRHGMNDD